MTQRNREEERNRGVQNPPEKEQGEKEAKEQGAFFHYKQVGVALCGFRFFWVGKSRGRMGRVSGAGRVVRESRACGVSVDAAYAWDRRDRD